MERRRVSLRYTLRFFLNRPQNSGQGIDLLCFARTKLSIPRKAVENVPLRRSFVLGLCLIVIPPCGRKRIALVSLVMLLMLGLTTGAGALDLLLTGSTTSRVCSANDAAERALSWLGEGRVFSADYDSGSGGYWVRILDREGYVQEIFVERRC